MIDENMMVALPFIHKSPYPLPPTPPPLWLIPPFMKNFEPIPITLDFLDDLTYPHLQMEGFTL